MLDQQEPSWQSLEETDVAALRASVAQASGLLRQAFTLAVSLDQIFLPDLPDAPLSAQADQSILQAIASLYLAMELESAGLLRALSAAAGLYMTGALRLGQGEVAKTLRDHHRNYENRTPTDDRYAAYLRLFGSAPEAAVPYATSDAVNTGLDENLLRLAEAMHRYANLSPANLTPLAAQREIRSAARLVGESLVMRGGGASHYLADEALGLIGTATSVFRDRALQQAFGARDLWGAAQAALDLQSGGQRRSLFSAGLARRARAHLTRGKAGMMLIGWVAQEAPKLHGIGGMDIDRADPILPQGTAWLEATLSLLSMQEESGNAF